MSRPYANPAPPSGDPPKTNDDFRAMLLSGKSREQPRGGAKKSKNSSKKPHEVRGKNSSRADEDAYRDRARERRERGDDANDALDGPSAEAALGRERGVFEREDAATRGDGTATTTEYARMKTIEESKYLGGDVERTHLVKGLDFALLNKVRSEIKDTKAMEDEERVAATAEREGGKPRFTTASARAIYEFMRNGSKASVRGKAHNIASGAVSYSFDLAANSRRDVPTTLHKATDDDGMAGVLVFNGVYASGTFGWDTIALLLLGIFTSTSAMVGAYLGGLVDDKLGSITTLKIAIGMTTLILIGLVSMQPDTVFFVVPVSTEPIWSSPYFNTIAEIMYLSMFQVFALFFVTGLSASRTLMAKISPPEMATQFFALYSLSGTVTAFLAPLLVGITTAFFQSQRAGFSSLILLMLTGAVMLFLVKEERSTVAPG